jgi:serine/threonine protein phosphatase PrpC
MERIIQKSSLIGHRDENQDTEIVFDNLDENSRDAPAILLLGIFDGHGPEGTMMSRKAASTFRRFLTHRSMSYPLHSKDILTISNRVQSALSAKPESKSSGTTSLIVIFYKNEENNSISFQVINTGDCRALLNRDDIGIQLTRDHKPGSYQERNRIMTLFAHYKGNNEKIHRTAKLELDRANDWRICGLSVSRAYGDLEATPYVSHKPDCFSNYNITSRDSFIMLGCDGIWDVFSNTDISDFVMERMVPDSKTGRPVLKDKNLDVSKEICNEAIKRGSMDNVSCIIVFI